MATVTGATAQRVEEVEDKIISQVSRQGYNLVFTTEGGQTIIVNNAFPAPYEMHPVGSIMMTSDSRNPSTYMGGGSWARWGKGRVPVSIDELQAEFDGIEEVGGAKTHTLTIPELPSHNHNQDPHQHALNMTTSPYYGGASGPAQPASGNDITHYGYTSTAPAQPPIQYTGGNMPHNNLQPYITCYMWKRTG